MYNEASQELGSFRIPPACQQPSPLDRLDDEPPSIHSPHTRRPVHRGPEVRHLKNPHVSHQAFRLVQKFLLTSFHPVQLVPFSFQGARAETGLGKGAYGTYIKQAASGR